MAYASSSVTTHVFIHPSLRVLRGTGKQSVYRVNPLLELADRCVPKRSVNRSSFTKVKATSVLRIRSRLEDRSYTTLGRACHTIAGRRMLNRPKGRVRPGTALQLGIRCRICNRNESALFWISGPCRNSYGRSHQHGRARLLWNQVRPKRYRGPGAEDIQHMQTVN